MDVIIVAGPWGSGTTAVIGALNSLGVPTLGPYFQSSDSNTKNTFELVPFRDLILSYVDEATLTHKRNYRSEFVPALEQFRIQLENVMWSDQRNNTKKLLALKMPLASICLPEICNTFKTKIIVVLRPLEEIEAGRLRRNWISLYGSLGAYRIYNRIFQDLVEHKLSFLGISYDDLVNNTCQSLKKIIEYCDLNDLQKNLESAKTFVVSP